MMQGEITDHFDKESGKLIAMLSSLSQDQLNKVPFEDSWTAAQVGDHLRRSYGVETLTGSVGPTTRHPDEKLEILTSIFLNFSEKFKSPEFILPSEDLIDKKVLLSDLESRVNRINAVAQTEDLSLTCLDFEFPGQGTLTRLELIGFFGVHTQRHNRQLENIINRLRHS